MYDIWNIAGKHICGNIAVAAKVCTLWALVIYYFFITVFYHAAPSTCFHLLKTFQYQNFQLSMDMFAYFFSFLPFIVF